MTLTREAWGICAVIGAVVLFSVQDMTFKLLSDRFALHQIVFIRASVAGFLTIFVLAPLTGGFSQLATKRVGAHLLRGGALVIGNMTFFLSLASLPLSNAVATFFSAPLIISVLAVIVLGEPLVKSRLALAVLGFCGVLLIVGPGLDGFGVAAVLPLIAACAYSTMQLMTRHLSGTETAVALALYVQVMFLASSMLVWVIAGDGDLNRFDNPSAQFLLRAWVLPTAREWSVLIGLGVLNAMGAYLIGIGYLLAQAGKAAPFEYIAVPMSLVWGLIFWQHAPEPQAWVGIALVLASGVAIALMRDGPRKVAP